MGRCAYVYIYSYLYLQRPQTIAETAAISSIIQGSIERITSHPRLRGLPCKMEMAILPVGVPWSMTKSKPILELPSHPQISYPAADPDELINPSHLNFIFGDVTCIYLDFF